MNKVLILFCHPRFEDSRANSILVRHIPRSEFVTFHDLYENFPDFNIDVNLEKILLAQHDIIVWHHPFYWYSSPPLLKQWIDLVLEFGWAYGPHGDILHGKIIFNAITSGGKREVYHRDGRNRFTIREFLAPFEQTAALCGMEYLPPFVVQGTHRLTEAELNAAGKSYGKLIARLIEGNLDPEEMKKFEFLNDWLENIEIRPRGKKDRLVSVDPKSKI
jgi:glutathione-regulated potassium-efflux system ancillary protein KefG